VVFGWEKGERRGRDKKIEIKKRWQGSKFNKGGRKKRGDGSNTVGRKGVKER
jgi:hypothetical protein